MTVSAEKGWTQKLDPLPQDCTENCDYPGDPPHDYALYDFGYAVGISDRSALVGIPVQSRVVTYKLSDAQEWQREQKLEALDRDPDNRFGRSIAFEGRRALIGASGAAYIFRQSEIEWTQLAKLVPPAGQPVGDFGVVVEQSNLTAVVGAPSTTEGGAVYVFETDGAGNVLQSTRLTAPGGNANDRFGERVSIDGDTLVASGRDAAQGNRWVVYIFERSNGGWSLSQVLEPDSGTGGAIHGLLVDGSDLFVGVELDTDEHSKDAGKVMVFDRATDGDFAFSEAVHSSTPPIAGYPHIYGFGDDIVATQTQVAMSSVWGLQSGSDYIIYAFVYDRTPLGLSARSRTVFFGTSSDLAISGATLLASGRQDSIGPEPGEGYVLAITAADAACARAGSIVVDGDSADWDGVPRQKLGFYNNRIGNGSPLEDDISANFRVQWDAARLYVLVEVRDDLLRGASTGIYNNDSVELYLDGGHQASSTYDADDYQLTVDWRGVKGGVRGQSISYDSAVATTPTGYTVEYSIPWSALGSSAVAAGRVIGLDVAINDNDTGGATRELQVIWHGDGTGWTDTSQFASYSLSADVCGGVGVTACARSSTVTIDGNSADWSSVPRHFVKSTAAVEGRPVNDSDSSASFRVQWDQSQLYALVEVRDDTNGSASNAVYLNDGVELYLDGLRERSHAYDSNDFQLTVDRRGVKGGVRGNALTYTSAVASRSDGFTVEYAVPWSALGVTPASFRVLGFDVGINDSDNSSGRRDSQLTWKGNGMGWYDTSTFDGLKLDSATCQ
ncbi:MAG: sugar-binding protein [Steroidobacteraceae bacterium]